MDAPFMESLGTKIRNLRKYQGLSLKQLGERVGCTPSYLSMVENDRIDPSVSRLKKIVDALGKTIVDLFGEAGDGDIIVRKEKRARVAFPGSKLLIEILVLQSPDKKLDARLATIAPGGGSEGDYRHPGEEFGIVLLGTMELTVDGTTYQLQQGDCFYFHSMRNHRFRNTSEQEAQVVWVNHPPSW
jgi:transcriptional regulator with XRE-family HTH domain